MANDGSPQSANVGRQGWLIAPILAAMHPVVSLYAESLSEAKLSDAVACGAVVVAIAVAISLVLRPIFGGPTRASLAAVVILVWSFTFHAYRRLAKLIIEPFWHSPWNEYVYMSVWIILLCVMLLMLFRLRWQQPRLHRLYQFAELACLFAVLFAALPIAKASWGQGPLIAAQPTIWASDDEEVALDIKLTAPPVKRDIYFVVLDRYASGEVLQKYFGFDNSAFYAELEKKGFVVNRTARTCYPMTALAMASTLNMRYLNSRFENVNEYFSSLDDNVVAKLLIEAGYKYVYFGNQYAPLRKSGLAEWNMKISMLPCEFADSLATMTPLRPVIGRQHKHAFVREKFREVGALASDPAPTFAYAHFLVPHPPYAFARDGSAVSEMARATRPEEELYIDQLVATNRMVLETLDEIIRNSATPPIILMLADEGPYLTPADSGFSSDEQIEKRSGILSALYFPDAAIRERLPAPLIPVNVFRFLFKEYFAAPIELLADRTFYWATPESSGIPKPGSEIVEIVGDQAQK